jgi:RNA polymerase sigma-70 factor (ECF subfamily)
MKAIKKLNAVDREILVLSRFQQLKYHEIALVVNLSEGAVKTRVHRAINELRNIYLKNGSYEL